MDIPEQVPPAAYEILIGKLPAVRIDLAEALQQQERTHKQTQAHHAALRPWGQQLIISEQCLF